MRLTRQGRRVRPVDPACGVSELPDLDLALEPFRRGGHPVNAATLMDISPANSDGTPAGPGVDDCFEIGELVTFAGLSARRLFESGGDGYCNSHCFQLVVQTLSNPSSQAAWAGGRRRDGLTRTLLLDDSRWVHAPPHVGGYSRVKLDEALLGALLAAREACLSGGDPQNRWERLRSAILQFNWANTDSDFVPQSAELIWVVGAFAQALGVRSKRLRDPIAQGFAANLVPTEPLPAAGIARLTQNGEQPQEPVRTHWIRKLVQARHRPAHGAIVASSGSDPWSIQEHLALAAVAFPLFIKGLLSKGPLKLYSLSSDDHRAIDLFETLATIDPFADSDVRNSWAAAPLARLRKIAARNMAAEGAGTEPE